MVGDDIMLTGARIPSVFGVCVACHLKSVVLWLDEAISSVVFFMLWILLLTLLPTYHFTNESISVTDAYFPALPCGTS